MKARLTAGRAFFLKGNGMNYGERQVAPTLDGIRADHVARYRWAATHLPPGQTVIDIGCGVGYGSKILADEGFDVHAYDKENEAHDYACANYNAPNIWRYVADVSQAIPFADADAAVAFEIIEHLANPHPLLRHLAELVPTLLASVPNETVFPYANHAFHHRHYTRAQFEELLSNCGWDLIEMHGQEHEYAEVERGVEGRTLVAVCQSRLCEKDQPASSNQQPAAESTPKHVAIVGLGPSASEYLTITKALGGKHKFCDETWGINAIGGVLQCDRIFHMDDVRIQQIRAEARPDGNIAAMLEWMKTTEVPIVTSRLHPDYPSLVEMPLEEMINDLTYDYFNNTAAWAMAYAIHIGVEKVTLFGCDYTYPDAHDAEKGRGCLEFWMGYGAGRCVKLGLPKTTTLMDAMNDRQERLYGYDTRTVDFIEKADGTLGVQFTEITDLPTADEIEAAYDHSKHPNGLMEKGD